MINLHYQTLAEKTEESQERNGMKVKDYIEAKAAEPVEYFQNHRSFVALGFWQYFRYILWLVFSGRGGPVLTRVGPVTVGGGLVTAHRVRKGVEFVRQVFLPT